MDVIGLDHIEQSLLLDLNNDLLDLIVHLGRPQTRLVFHNKLLEDNWGQELLGLIGEPAIKGDLLGYLSTFS